MQHISLNISVFSVYIPLFILNKYKYNEKTIWSMKISMDIHDIFSHIFEILEKNNIF